MTIKSQTLTYDQSTPPATYPLSEVTGISALGKSLLEKTTAAEMRTVMGTDAPTDTRPPSTHDHDGRYYTEAEMDALMALKSAVGHNHDTVYYTKAQVDAAVAAQGRRKVAFMPTQVTSQAGFGIVTNTDEIMTWGYSSSIILNRTDAVSGPNVPQVFTCNGARTGTWTKLIVTQYNLFAVTSTGELWGAGDNTVGQLGLGDTTNTDARRRYLHKITITGKTVRDVKMSHGDTTSVAVYAITTDNLLYSWGNNSNGQLGINSTVNASTPQFVVIPGAVAVADISVGGALATHVLVRTTDAKLHACGWNGNGQLGLGDTTDRLQLVTVTGKSVIDIRAWSGAYNAVVNYYGLSMILLTSGQVQLAGYNGGGAIGDGSFTQRTSFTGNTVNSSNVSVMMHMVTSAPHMSGYIAAGIVYLAGENGSGQLGDGSTTNRNTFVQPTGAFQGKATKIANVRTNNAGYATTFILDSDGAVWASGRNADSGLCADGTTIDRTSFAKIPMQEAITDIYVCGVSYTGGNTYVFALGISGRLYAWGNNNLGQLGLGHVMNLVRVPCEVRL